MIHPLHNKILTPTPSDIMIGEAVYKKVKDINLTKIKGYRSAFKGMNKEKFFNMFIGTYYKSLGILVSKDMKNVVEVSTYMMGYVTSPKIGVPYLDTPIPTPAQEDQRTVPGYEVRWETKENTSFKSYDPETNLIPLSQYMAISKEDLITFIDGL